MAECPCFRSCPFFTNQLAKTPALATLYKIKHCVNDFTSCSRYRVLQVLGFHTTPVHRPEREPDKTKEVLPAS